MFDDDADPNQFDDEVELEDEGVQPETDTDTDDDAGDYDAGTIESGDGDEIDSSEGAADPDDESDPGGAEDGAGEGADVPPAIGGINERYIKDGKIYGKFESADDLADAYGRLETMLGLQGSGVITGARQDTEIKPEVFGDEGSDTLNHEEEQFALNQAQAEQRQRFAPIVNKLVSDGTLTFQSGSTYPQSQADFAELYQQNPQLYMQMYDAQESRREFHRGKILEAKAEYAKAPALHEEQRNKAAQFFKQRTGLGDDKVAEYEREMYAKYGGNKERGLKPDPRFFKILPTGHRVQHEDSLMRFAIDERSDDLFKSREKLAENKRKEAYDKKRQGKPKPKPALANAKGQGATAGHKSLMSPKQFNDPFFLDKLSDKELDAQIKMIDKLQETDPAKYAEYFPNRE